MQTEQRYYSPEEYLALEEAADYKSEYIDGKIIPMTGGTTNHNRISLNFSAELNFAFKKLDIEVLSKSTQAYGRSKKFKAYRTIPSFAEYILVSQDQVYVEQFHQTVSEQ